ncbi:S41 family peptidase [Marinilongibacter aquaticus]|uniref:S41 family peptidase n=1 Tax=Marinilongibacter aquaticus TaxID=2975157 RepID=UPI0021BD0191|nr:S41 family peptidase [Marinilongibacter aquaticus]UBM57703.1 S41 family peptidase [Marinilongibacter aquaticus]
MDQKKINNSKFNIRLPIIIAITLAAGIQIGAKFFGSRTAISDVVKSSSKFKEILTYIDQSYVDPVNTDSLADYGIQKMLEKLDPHTAYLPAKEAELAEAELQNGFDGIGVEFNIFNDTVYVVTPLSGGPSEEAGILSGDAIIEANGTALTGDKVNTPLIFNTLRGKKGTKVDMKIKRKGFGELLDFSVIRDKIPTFSVDASYLMPDNITGYLKVSRFSETTYDEFINGMQDLKDKGMQRLILDLRGNPGGYLERAVSIADEFIPGSDILVYTDGKDDRNDRRINAGHKGVFEQGSLIVLIDEGSASASEIVSGALQDYDRALIVGRRSFGKGLVQAPISLSDGSELRLTIARYYIPSGRSIQKPYVNGDLEDYYNELYERGEHGEFFSADSIHAEQGKAFKTMGGRTVYGGGGITPDVFVPRDTSHVSTYLFELYNKNVIREYALHYANVHEAELKKQSVDSFVRNFEISEAMCSEIVKEANKVGVKHDAKGFTKSKPFIQNQVKALIARAVWKDENGLSNSFYKVVNTDDEAIKVALKSFGKAEKLEGK